MLRDLKPSSQGINPDDYVVQIHSQENDPHDYVVQIQPYFIQPPPFKIAEPLKTAEPLKIPEKMDMTINLAPLQFTQRFQPSMRTDAPPAK